MPKKRKTKDLNRGPFEAKDFDRQLRRIGYKKAPGGKHDSYIHPSRPGKVSVSTAWTSIKCGDRIFNSIADQSGLGKSGLLRVMNGLDA